jgi:hypothetical protein
MDVRMHAHFASESQSFPWFEARKLARRSERAATPTTTDHEFFESLGAKNQPTIQEEIRHHIGV